MSPETSDYRTAEEILSEAIAQMNWVKNEYHQFSFRKLDHDRTNIWSGSGDAFHRWMDEKMQDEECPIRDSDLTAELILLMHQFANNRPTDLSAARSVIDRMMQNLATMQQLASYVRSNARMIVTHKSTMNFEWTEMHEKYHRALTMIARTMPGPTDQAVEALQSPRVMRSTRVVKLNDASMPHNVVGYMHVEPYEVDDGGVPHHIKRIKHVGACKVPLIEDVLSAEAIRQVRQNIQFRTQDRYMALHRICDDWGKRRPPT